MAKKNVQVPLMGTSLNDPVPQSYDPAVWPYPIPFEDIVLRVSIEAEPLSKKRARIGRNGGMYTPQDTRDYETSLNLIMSNAVNSTEPDRASKFGLRCIFYRSNRQRIDCDNMIKVVADAATKTGVIWGDDNQVIEIIGRTFLACEVPHTDIVIYKVGNPFPHQKCPECGKEFITFKSTNVKHCSAACASKSKHVTLICRECGEHFDIVQSMAKKRGGFCSRECSMRYHGRKKTQERGPQTWKCQDCGGPVSRKEYTRCRACSMKHRQEPTSNYWRVRYGDKKAS